MQEETYINNLSTDESEMLREAIFMSLPKLGLEQNIFDQDEMKSIKILDTLSKELFGEPYSYNLLIDVMLKGYNINHSGNIESKEEAILKKIIPVFIKSLSDEQRKKFAKEYKFADYNNIEEFVNSVVNRFILSDKFRSLMPLLMVSTLKSAKYLFATPSISLLAPSLIGTPLFSIISVVSSVFDMFNSITTKTGKKISVRHLNDIFIVLYIIHRNHKIVFRNAEECIQYLSAVIKNDTQFSEEETTVAILSSIILYKDESKVANKIKESFSINLNLDENKLLPSYILQMIYRMGVSEKNLIINFLMERLFPLEKIEKENIIQLNKDFEDQSIGYIYYTFPYTNICNKWLFFPKTSTERPNNKKYLTLSEYLYVYSKGLNPFEYIRYPYEHEKDKYKLCISLEQVSIVDELPKSCKRDNLFCFNKSIPLKEVRKTINEILLLPIEEFAEFLSYINKDAPEVDIYKHIYNLRLENQKLKSRLESVSQAIHRVKHDIKPEIGAIRSYVKDNKEVIVKRLSKIGQNIDKLVNFVDNPNLEYKNITDIIKDYVSNHSYEDCLLCNISREDIPLTVKLDVEFVPTVIDSIINNARNHGFVRNDKKYIINFLLEDSNNEIRLTISNNGKSFDGDLQKIFDYKYKYGPSGNTGEGLYLAKEYMKRIGGDIRLVSSPQSEFPVTFVLTFKK